jgi:hypothetical protein
MPITLASFSFGTGNDVHVLRGQSTVPLAKLLGVFPATGSICTFFEYVNDRHQTDVGIEFRPVFRCDENATEFFNFGIHVNRTDGTVSVDPGAPPAHQPFNFIVEATVTRNAGVPGPGEFPVTIIRVHVHGGVDRIWLTPQNLTIRRPVATGDCKTSYGFTVRAQFDDGTVGDVTSSEQIDFLPPTHFYVRPDEKQRRIQLPASAGVGSHVPVTVTTSAAWGSRASTGPHELIVAEPWATESNVPQAEWLDGKADIMNGSVKPETVPNILFMATGFADTSAFKSVVTMVQSNLVSDSVMHPFNFLRTSMAYWHLPIQASENGPSVQCEVWPYMRGALMFAAPLPKAVPPPSTGEWSVGNLIYFAGLPVPDDVNRTMPELNDRWDEVMPDIPERVVMLSVVDKWLALAKRTYIDEIDNFPCMSIGSPPEAERGEDLSMGLHGRRADDNERTEFLKRVTAKPIGTMAPITLGLAPPEDALGNLWAKDHAAFPFDNTRYVVALANSPLGRANSGINVRFTFSGPDVDDENSGFCVVPATDGRNALRLNLPVPSNATIFPDTWTTIGHEIAHNFDLGDEYVEDADTYTLSGDMDEANLTTADVVLKTDGAVRLDKIKWNWHRARKAVVTTGKIVPLGGKRFQVPVAFGAGFQLAVDEPVLLRKRVKRKVIAGGPKTSVEFKIESLSADGDKIVIVTTASVSNLDDFGAGSVLYKPFIAPTDVVPARKYMTLVSPAAERLMRDVIKGPLNGVTCNAATNASLRASTEWPTVADPQNKMRPGDLVPMVGLYHGGHYACGVLRPAGQCMMRDNHDMFTLFCHVCRFVLVEQIDPEQHRHIDYEYQKVYSF